MAWKTFQSRDGIYAVDWQGVSRIIRSYVRSKAMLSPSNTKVNEDSHWFGPTLHTVDVNWDQVRQQTDAEGEMLLSNFYQMLRYNPEVQTARLVHWADQTRLNNAKFHQLMRDAQKKTMENIDKSVERAEIGLKIARATRDISAEFLMVSATIVSGGGALAAAAAVGGVTVGAGLKATAKGQDDPSATNRQIAATFATEFTVGMLDLGAGKFIDKAAEKAAEAALEHAVGSKVARELEKKAVEKGTKTGLAILWNQVKGVAVEPTKAIVEGETFRDGLVTGGLKMAGGVHGEILKYLVLDDKKFQKLAAVADTTISLAADALSKSITEKKENERTETPELTKPETDEHALLDCLAYERRMVEQMALQKVGSYRPPVPTNSGIRPATSFRR